MDCTNTDAKHLPSVSDSYLLGHLVQSPSAKGMNCFKLHLGKKCQFVVLSVLAGLCQKSTKGWKLPWGKQCSSISHQIYMPFFPIQQLYMVEVSVELLRCVGKKKNSSCTVTLCWSVSPSLFPFPLKIKAASVHCFILLTVQSQVFSTKRHEIQKRFILGIVSSGVGLTIGCG